MLSFTAACALSFTAAPDHPPHSGFPICVRLSLIRVPGDAQGSGAPCNATAACGGFEELCVGGSLYDNRSWHCTSRSLLSLNQRSMLPAVIPHRVASAEFVTPDYFGGLRGDPHAGSAAEAKCFLTSNYGRGPEVNTTEWNKHAHGYVNATVTSGFGYASMVLGTQVDGEPLDVDWSSVRGGPAIVETRRRLCTEEQH